MDIIQLITFAFVIMIMFSMVMLIISFSVYKSVSWFKTALEMIFTIKEKRLKK